MEIIEKLEEFLKERSKFYEENAKGYALKYIQDRTQLAEKEAHKSLARHDTCREILFKISTLKEEKK